MRAIEVIKGPFKRGFRCVIVCSSGEAGATVRGKRDQGKMSVTVSFEALYGCTDPDDPMCYVLRIDDMTVLLPAPSRPGK